MALPGYKFCEPPLVAELRIPESAFGGSMPFRLAYLRIQGRVRIGGIRV